MDSVKHDGSFDRPARLGNAVSRLIRNRGLAERSSNNALKTAWKNAVGDALAARSSVKKLQAGILVVNVTNGAALEELRGFRHDEVLQSLRQAFPDTEIRNIRYVRQTVR
jgi:hypothetical protein